MSASDPALMSAEDNHAVEDEKRCLLNVPLSLPPASARSPSSPFPNTAGATISNETVIESKVVSMASNDCSSALSSPAKASPAKPAETSTSAFNGTFNKSPATSPIVSASDQLKCTETSLINISGSPPWSSALPSTMFGSPDVKKDFPSVLTFKGVSVTLENNSVWKQFYSCGTEMILTKQGRRMFPYCRYRLSGLDPKQKYSLVLSIVPSGQYRYRWNISRWEVMGPAEHQAQSLIRAFPHHYSPCQGSEWMNCLVSFYKLKLTNNPQDPQGHMVLHSMHRYIPRLHIIPVPDGDVPMLDQPVVMGPESMTFTFPQSEFMAVTTYQNFRITQLKINHNPFAKGFREDGNNPRLNRIPTEARAAVERQAPPAPEKPAEPSGHQEEEVDLSTKSQSDAASLSSAQETRAVLKPIMSNPASTGEQYVPCIRGKHALGELVLVQKRPRVETKETSANCVTPEEKPGSEVWKLPKASSRTPSSSASTPRSSPQCRRRKKKINKRWGNSRGRLWKAAAASPTVVHSPSLTVAMQPELDEVEGLLFVSFTSKEALEVHVGDKAGTNPSPVSVTTPAQSEQIIEVNPETVEEKVARLELVLLNDLGALRHRQVIHPVLREVGLKLNSLDPSMPIDLQYLGVRLPLPPPNLPEQSHTAALARADEGVPFISRTGKTSDMTKIKGWKNKFIKSKESSPNCEGLQKNLSAFCSNMLDEYLESEAQQISERAAAFSANPEGAVAYQLPAKSSSYVKTLDSVLKHQNTASKFPVGTSRPCPLSHKPHLQSALMSPPSRLTGPATPNQTAAQSRCPSVSSRAHIDAAFGSNGVSQRLSPCLPEISQRPAASQVMAHKPSGFSKIQLKLLHMEMEALNQGLSRTWLTPERLTMALSAMLTKRMVPGQLLKAAPVPESEVVGPECGQRFCRLGCVCSSLQHLHRGPLHCRRPDCMLGCTCFKRKIFKQMNAEESEDQNSPVYSVTNVEHTVLPLPGSHAKKMWNYNCCDEDPEPLFAPKAAPLSSVPPKILKRVAPCPVQLMREEDKDPVYRYLESKMTCARVREFNSKPPPEVTLDTNPPAATFALISAAPQAAATTHRSTVLTAQKAGEKSPQESTFNESEARKQIQIQSMCQWRKDRQMVLGGLCERMNQNRLNQRFYIGPYCIIPVAKVLMRKPSGSVVTYRIQITKPSKVSDIDEDESDDCDEEKLSSDSFDENTDAEEEDEQLEDPENRFGVTPFLCGVTPAGRLRARRKRAGCQASGLIQVNGKRYNQARLLLGNMGSLHPANRLAAYVTGRLHVPGDRSNDIFRKPDSKQKRGTLGSSCEKVADTAVPPKKTTGLKTATQPLAPLIQPEFWIKGSSDSTSVPIQSSSIFQSSSTSSPVSLTVSPSLKSPSFLAQSGTCSFRICPPSNQAAGGAKPHGVSLPGGFTLIQLPKPGADAGQTKPLNATDAVRVGDGPAQKGRVSNLSQLASEWLSVDTLTRVKNLLSDKTTEPGPFFGLICEEKNKPLDESEANSCQAVKQEETSFDVNSEDLSSDFSDYGEGEEDDDAVDVETVEEAKQEKAIAKMKEAVMKTLQESRGSVDDCGSLNEIDVKDEQGNLKNRRRNHTAIERLRRCEQRVLFDRLRSVLNGCLKTPKLHLLSLAVKEIQNLVKTSKSMEEKKKMLARKQAAYVKQLSLLAGKPEGLILSKLKEITERQKRQEKTMKWRPFFSQLLQTKAALVQATARPCDLQPPPPLLQPDYSHPPQANLPKTAQTNLLRLLTLLHPKGLPNLPAQRSPMQQSLPQAASLPPQAAATAPSSQMELQQNELASLFPVSHPSSKLETKQEASGDPDQATIPNIQTKDQPQAPSDKAALQVTAAQNGASSGPSVQNPKRSKVQPLKSLTPLPLIRSKTGRIILPSSLKPSGHGFYTLRVMKPGKKGDDTANTQPSEADSPKCSEKNMCAPDRPSELEPGHALESSVAPSDPDPKRAGVFTPLTQLAFLNNTIIMSPLDLEVVENNEEPGTGVSLSKAQASARLCFNPVRLVPVAAESEPSPPDASPPVIPCRRGRPPKNRLFMPPVIIPENSVSKTPPPIEKKQRDTIPVQDTKMLTEAAPVVADDPVPVKRPRGRPPKKKLAMQHSPPLKWAARSPSDDDDGPVSFSVCKFKSPDKPGQKRPLTRGSLGKDFPSAKKRSWIDVERELEPDLDSE